MSKDALSIWTVYDHPIDMPEYYIARRFEVKRGGEGRPTHDYIRDHDLMRLRSTLEEKGLHRIPRWEGDDPKIVESWI
jgi:hypothetical protein